MLKLLLLAFFIYNAAFAGKLTLDERRKKILSIVDEELTEVSRLAKTQDYRAPETLLRVAELNLEKARLYREVENEQYLAIPVEERVKLNKEEYFRQSTRFFEAANDAGNLVVKKFPRYKNIGDVYYILAYNYKELGDNQQAQKFFRLATQNSTDPKIQLKSKIALADYYFNEKKFAEAIPLYEAALSKTDEKWWTKDAYNLAWCHYRQKNYDRAISLMREVHKKSGGKYVDMRSSVERDIGIFYTDANRINDAVTFYESHGINYTEQFIRIATAVVSQGRFEQAENLLEKVKAMEKDSEKRVEILLAQLSLFDKFGKSTEHLATAKELVSAHQKAPLEKSAFERLSFQVNKKAAELQKATTSELYKGVSKVRKQKAAEAIAYFELASLLAPGQKSEKVFFQAETAYAAGEYIRAIGLYTSAFDDAKSSGNKKIMGEALEGMLSSLAQGSLPKNVAEKSYIPVYSRYVSFDSRSDRASSIYVKLFNAQFDAGDIAAAESTMTSFAKSFPGDYKTQEAMLAKVMERHRSKKDYAAVKGYVKRINEGEFKISAKYADALRSLMTKIQIEGVQQSLERGDKGTALSGYHQIYQSSESTPKARTNAAYNLSALYYEMGEANQSYQWAVTALKDMDPADISKFADSFLSIAAGLFLRQQFAQSADLSHRMMTKLCSETTQNKIVAYKNAVFISLANGDLDKAVEIRNSGKACAVSEDTITEVSLEILKDLGKIRRWETYETIITDLDAAPRNHVLLIRPLEELRKQFVAIGNTDEARTIAEKQNRYYQEGKSQKTDIPVEALDLISERMLALVIEKRQKLEQIQLTFPEATFNQAVKSKLQLLDQMTTDVNALQKVGSGKGIVEANRQVIDAYEQFGNELKRFTPEGKSPEYLESFRQAMAEVHGPILQNARKQRAEVKKLIMENKILSYSNYSVLYPETDKLKRFFTEKEAVLMDRGGRR